MASVCSAWGRRLKRRSWTPVALVAIGLVIAGIAAQGSGLQWGEREVAWQEPAGSTELFQPQPEESTEVEDLVPVDERSSASLPDWISWLVLGLLVGVPLALLAYFMVRRVLEWLIDARGVYRPAEETRLLRRDISLVEQAVEAGLAEIDLGDDPRSAIIACWVHFESVSEAVGIPREASDVPSDLTRKLLEAHQLERDTLERLSAAYLRARYSPREVGESDRDSARRALVDLQRQLGVKEGR